MGLKNIEGYGTFGKMDRQRVIGFLKSTGTRDPDILSLQKQKLIAPNKGLKMGSYGMMVFGVILLPLMGAGIPVILLGIWMYWFGARNIKLVEAAYIEYLASRPA
ncbi:MAG: hypothetical protein ACYCOR_01230 [Acidobacteriaceae bacterium]